MDETIKLLLNYGALGIMVALLCFEVMYLQKGQKEDRDKFSKSIDQNTSAFHALKDIIHNCQNIHKD